MSLHHVFAATKPSQDALNLTPEEVLLEAQELHEDEQRLALLRSEIEEGSHSIEKIISCADVALGLASNGVKTNLTSAVFAEQLAVSGIPESVAETVSAGLESEGEEVGNEALEGAKDLIMNIVQWLVEKWEDFKALMRRTFNKYFGSVQRSTEAWRKLQAKIGAYQDEGRVIDDKSKLEVKSGAAWFVVGESNSENPKTVVPWSKMVAELEKFESLETAVSDALNDDKLIEFPDSFDDITTHVGKFINGEMSNHFKGQRKDTFDIGTEHKSGRGLGLLGRIAFYTGFRKNGNTFVVDGTKDESIRKGTKSVNSFKAAIRPSNVKLKSLEEVKVEVATLAELEAIADTYVELGTKMLNLQTAKILRKVEKAFDKAIASTKKWAKDASDDTPEARRIASAKAGLGVAQLNFQQDITLGLANDLLRNYASMAKAHGAVASQSLRRYKAA